MTTPVRVLLVGAGRMGLSHLKSIQSMPELGQVVAGVDPSEEARRRLETEYGVSESYSGLGDALARSDVDAVLVASPNHLHAEYVITSLRAGKHAFVEKPMALTLDDVDRMIGEAEDRGLLLMSGQTLRFITSMRYIKKLVDEGTVGKVLHVIHRRTGSGRGGDETSWFSKQALSGGVLPGIGTHSLDAIMWWLGQKAETAYAVVRNLDPHPDIDIEDEASIVATTEGGAILSVVLDFHHKAGTEWIVAGDAGVIHLRGMSEGLVVSGEEHTIPDQVMHSGEPQIHREFLTAIQEGRPLAEAAAADVRNSMALIFAAQESGRTGQAVTVA